MYIAIIGQEQLYLTVFFVLYIIPLHIMILEILFLGRFSNKLNFCLVLFKCGFVV